MLFIDIWNNNKKKMTCGKNKQFHVSYAKFLSKFKVHKKYFFTIFLINFVNYSALHKKHFHLLHCDEKFEPKDFEKKILRYLEFSKLFSSRFRIF